MTNICIKEIKTPYKSSYLPQAIIHIEATSNVIILNDDVSIGGNQGTGSIKYSFVENNISVTTPSGSEDIITTDLTTSKEYNFDLTGIYRIRYYGKTARVASGYRNEYDYSVSFLVAVVQNRLPLKKWTVTEVLNRLFDLAEPIHIYQKPRFRLQGVNDDGTFAAGSQAEKFDKILSPEFAFTKQTLRECLKQIGGFIHGEPRLTPKKDGAGTWYYEVSYDMYGGTEQWRYAKRNYIANTVAYTAEQFATALDTNPENLINKLKDYTGVTIEPYRSGAKSVRTEEMYVQITETNMLISTQRPIYTIEKVEYIESASQEWDITPYIFESSVYNSQLSSYGGQYPYSKAYGLMYTQGEKNITALNFKQENPLSEVFSRYAIVNIIRETTGNGGFMPSDYATLRFRVTYTPIYNARVKQVKTNYTEYGTEATQIYNQSANLIESRAFGENLKGVIARMGNPEISRTYMFSRLNMIPRAGMKFDDDYYISGVFTEYYTSYIRCTVALTKDFNRISEYIGIPQYKRYSQISQNMAVERNIVYEEYVVIGDNDTTDGQSMIGNKLMSAIVGAITQSQNGVSLTHVIAWGGSYQDSEGSAFNAVSLPVVASAYGNSISFSWEYADNYSAGATSQFKESDGTVSTKVSGYFQQDYEYADYYGRMYYYNFNVDIPGTADIGIKEATRLPAAERRPDYTSDYISTLRGGSSSLKGNSPFIVRKDNREKLQVNVQVHYVTNRKGLIIGSALASNCLAVRSGTRGAPAKLYVLPERIDKFAENLEAVGIILEQYPSVEIAAYSLNNSAMSPYIQLAGDNTFPARGKAWVIASPPTRGEEEQVENEKGEQSTVTQVTGGDLLLAQNMDISAGQAFAPIYFTKKRNVYNGAVWKDRR